MIIDASTEPVRRRARVPSAPTLPVSVVRPAPARPRRLVLFAACFGYLLLVIACWMILRLEGDRSWVGSLMLFSPRWPIALPLPILALWSLLARRWWRLAATAGAGLIVLVPIMGFRLAIPSGGDQRADIRLLTCNIHRQHLRPEALSAYIAEVRPDIVALQAWSSMHDGSIFDGGWHVRRDGELLVASRFPIGNVTPVQFEDAAGVRPGERGAAAVFEVHTPEGPVYVINVHIASAHAGLAAVGDDKGRELAENLAVRRREMRTVRAVADSLHGPILVAGDFNTTDDSPIFRENWAGYTDAFLARGSGFGLTYRIRLTQLRIDHVLAAPPARFARCWIGPEVGSPHRPLVVDVNRR